MATGAFYFAGTVFFAVIFILSLFVLFRSIGGDKLHLYLSIAVAVISGLGVLGFSFKALTA